MKVRTKRFILSVLIAECIVFGYAYFFGNHGLRVILTFCKENEQKEAHIIQLNDEIAQLVSAIDEWDKYPFYKEKFAREQLQMAAPGDELYLIDSKD